MGRQVEDIRVACIADAAPTDAGVLVLVSVQPVMVVSLGAPIGIVGA